MPRKRAWLSWSSGKDSALALTALENSPEVEIVGLATSVAKAHGRVAMHGVRESLLAEQAKVLGLPLYQVELPSPCSHDIYLDCMRQALSEAKRQNISYWVFGDLFLEDVRNYRYSMLAGTGMAPLFPLWNIPTTQLSRRIIDSGIKAVLTCIDPNKLAKSFAGREYDEKLLSELPTGIDACGENGEFHTFVYDAPFFRESMPIMIGDFVERDGFVFADVLKAPSKSKSCSLCGTKFRCGAHDPAEGCWCAQLPPLNNIINGIDCLCATCLREKFL